MTAQAGEIKTVKAKQPKTSIIRQRAGAFLTFIFMPAFLVIIWQWGSSKGLINQHILPAPTKEVATFAELIASGKLQRNLLVSAVRVVQGFAFGAASGLILGGIMGLSRTIHKLMLSLVGIFRPIPMIAWIPLLILWMGIGEPSKVTVIAMGSFWPILLNTIQGFQTVDKKLLEVADILEKSRWQVISRVIFPSAIPSIFTGIRLGISSAWTCVVAAEMIAASEGIGYMITYARELTQPHVMLVGVFSIGFIGLFIDTLVLKLQKHLLKWNVTAEK
ncbi:MAG: ABC transporter permease [Candidatus Ornithomonoglobus sp.]